MINNPAIKKIKAAVIGCGAIHHIYLQNMTQIFSILDVVACCDLNKELAQETAKEYNIEVKTEDEIKADASIEMVINLTNPLAHYSVISGMLKAGKHVYTEKTITDKIEDAFKLVELADEKGLHLGAAPDTFLGAALQTARWALDAGMIGRPTSCVATLNRDGGLMAERFPYTARPGGGIALDVGIYYVTALLSLLGPVSEVCGFYDTVDKERTHWFTSKEDFGQKYTVENENLLAGSMRFSNGVIGSLQFNSNCIQNEAPFMTIFGTQGILYLPNPNHFGGEVRFQAKGTWDTIVLPHTHGYAENSRGLGCADMAWAITKNRLPRADKSLALHCMEVLTGIMESSESKTFHTMKSTFKRPEPIPRGYLGKNYSMSEEESALTV